MTLAPALRPDCSLPTPLTALIGRERETAELRALLDPDGDGPRLLTLIGVGGGGKTRLALAVAHALADAYPDAARYVELAPLADPVFLPQAIAAALGLREQPARPLLEQVVERLRPQAALLVLDNCEHLIDACAHLAETLLAACPHLRLLATSREALRVPGEVVWLVPPLATADPAHLPPLARLPEYPAVRLFVDRARAQRPDFALGEGNARAVAEICRRLDGIPLALELAAARVGALGVGALAGRLGDALRLLTGGNRTAPTRQQTLRATLEWSHRLLAAPQRALFRRLAVFAGGFDVAACEAVCADDALPAAEVLDLLVGLVEQSLVVLEGDDGAGRYRLLEPVRQYAAEQLAREPSGQGEAEPVRSRHAAHYLALAERAGDELLGPEQLAWLARLDRDLDNLRAALHWTAEQGGRAGAEAGLRFGAALWRFWWSRGYLREGRDWLGTFLRAEGAQARTLPRARALFAAGRLVLHGGDYGAARAQYEESLAIAQELGEDEWTAGALTQLGHLSLNEGDYATARTLYEEALVLRQARGDRRGLAISHYSLGEVALASSDYAEARTRLEQALALYHEVRDDTELAQAHDLLGDVAVAEGDRSVARRHYAATLARHRRLGHRWGVARALEGFALLAAAGGRVPLPGAPAGPGGVERAVRLLGAVAALADHIGGRTRPARRDRLRRLTEEARSQLGEQAYAAAWQAGRALSLDEAVAEALAVADDADPALPSPAPARGAVGAHLPAGLTTREVEVLRLIAAGRSNQEIADALHLSIRTVERHIANLYAKLGARHRGDAVAFAFRQGLAPPEATEPR